MELFYREYGEGKPLIVLHGLFGFSDNWVTLARQFASRGYHMYLVDQRNHGNSPHAEEWNYEVMAEDLRDFVEKHELERPVVLGHSMGGKTAMEFAVRYPNMLEKLIVADIAPKAYPVHHQQIIEGLSAVRLEELTKRSEADRELQKYVQETGVRQFLLKNLARDAQGNFRWKMNLPVIRRHIEEVVRPVCEGAHFMKPALFLRGGKSDYITEVDYPLIEDIFTDVKFVCFEQAGHWLHAEEPARVLEEVLAFLEE